MKCVSICSSLFWGCFRTISKFSSYRSYTFLVKFNHQNLSYFVVIVNRAFSSFVTPNWLLLVYLKPLVPVLSACYPANFRVLLLLGQFYLGFSKILLIYSYVICKILALGPRCILLMYFITLRKYPFFKIFLSAFLHQKQVLSPVKYFFSLYGDHHHMIFPVKPINLMNYSNLFSNSEPHFYP